MKGVPVAMAGITPLATGTVRVAPPTGNALYERLGHRPVEDRTVMEFA